MPTRISNSTALVVLVFIYAVSVFLLFRIYLVAWVSPQDGPTGAAQYIGDAPHYEALAKALLDQIRMHGWSSWILKPGEEGVPGIAAAIYAALGHEPLLIVVLNAMLHALSSLTLVTILSSIFERRVAILAALPFVISPYQMHWFSQLNKDSFNVLGVFLFLLGVVRLLEPARRTAMGVALAVAGLLLIGLIRPYMISALTLPVALGFVCESAWTLRRRNSLSGAGTLRLSNLALLIGVCFAVKMLIPPSASSQTLSDLAQFNCKPGPGSSWHYATHATERLERPLCVISKQRDNFDFIHTDPNPTTRALSPDLDLKLTGTVDVLAYVPRAALLGFLSPFPADWSVPFVGPRSVFRSVVGCEMLVAYVGMAGVLMFLFSRADRTALWIIGTCSIPILVIGLGIPHIGSINRYRYAYLIAIEGIGLGYLIDVYVRSRTPRYAPPSL